MTQTLLVVVMFVAAMACLPWVVRRLQLRQTAAAGAAGMSSRVVSAVAVGPQQRVVTVEVGPPSERLWLVLGVTAQQINCLHVVKAADSQATGASVVAPSFASAVTDAVAGLNVREKGPHA